MYVDFYRQSEVGYDIVLNGLSYGFTHQQRVLIAEIIKNQNKKNLNKYEIKNYKDLLPSKDTILWLSFFIFIAKSLNKDKSFPKVTFRLENGCLIIVSDTDLYLFEEFFKNLKSIIKVYVKTT